MGRRRKNIKSFLAFLALIITFVTPICYPQQLMTQEEAESAFGEALALYKRGNFQESLFILNKIQSLASNWNTKKVQKYIVICHRKVKEERARQLETPQESWWQALYSEEYDQPISASVEILFNEYKKLRGQLEEKELRLNYLNDQLKKLQTDSTVLQIRQLSRKNAFHEEKTESLQKRIEGLSEYSQELENKIEANREKNTSAINGLKNKLKKQTSSLQAKDIEITKLSDENQGLQLKLKTSKTELSEELTAVSKKAKDDLGEAQEKLKEQKVSLEAKDTSIAKLSINVQSLELKLKNANAKLAKVKEKIVYKTSPEQEKEIEALKQRITSLSRKKSNLKETDAVISELKDRLGEQKISLAAKGIEISKLDGENQRLRFTLENAEQKLLEANENEIYGSQQEGNEVLKQQITALKENVEEADLIIETLNTKLKRQESSLKNNNLEIANLLNNIGALEAKLKDLKSKFSKSRGQITYSINPEQEKEIEDLKQRITALSKKDDHLKEAGAAISELKDRLGEQKISLAAKDIKIDRLGGENQKLQLELENTKQKLLEADENATFKNQEREIKTLKQQITALNGKTKDDLEEAASVISELKSELNKQNTSLGTKSSEIAKLSIDIKSLQLKLKSSEERLSKLRNKTVHKIQKEEIAGLNQQIMALNEKAKADLEEAALNITNLKDDLKKKDLTISNLKKTLITVNQYLKTLQ